MPYPIHLWPSRSLSYLAMSLEKSGPCLARLSRLRLRLRLRLDHHRQNRLLQQHPPRLLHPTALLVRMACPLDNTTANGYRLLARPERSAVGIWVTAVAITPAVHYPAPCASSSSPRPATSRPIGLVRPAQPSFALGPLSLQPTPLSPMSLVARAYALEPLSCSSPKVA